MFQVCRVLTRAKFQALSQPICRKLVQGQRKAYALHSSYTSNLGAQHSPHFDVNVFRSLSHLALAFEHDALLDSRSFHLTDNRCIFRDRAHAQERIHSVTHEHIDNCERGVNAESWKVFVARAGNAWQALERCLVPSKPVSPNLTRTAPN